jgi:hypothetical protein
MKVDDLVSPLVPDEDYEGTMVVSDIIIDESRNTLVELLPHAEGIARDEEVKKSRVGHRYDNHVVI